MADAELKDLAWKTNGPPGSAPGASLLLGSLAAHTGLAAGLTLGACTAPSGPRTPLPASPGHRPRQTCPSPASGPAPDSVLEARTGPSRSPGGQQEGHTGGAGAPVPHKWLGGTARVPEAQIPETLRASRMCLKAAEERVSG